MSPARKTAACLTAEFSVPATTISHPPPLRARTTSPDRGEPSAPTHDPRTGCDHSCAKALMDSATTQLAQKSNLFMPGEYENYRPCAIFLAADYAPICVIRVICG